MAASAPVLALEGLRWPTPNPESFAETVTRAAGPAGGAAEECSGNVRRAFAVILSGTDARNGARNGARNDAQERAAEAAMTTMTTRTTTEVVKDLFVERPGIRGGKEEEQEEEDEEEEEEDQGSAEVLWTGIEEEKKKDEDSTEALRTGVEAGLDAFGRPQYVNAVVEEGSAKGVARSLRVCPDREPRGENALLELAWWARAAFDYLSMGNYPYATGYILNSGEGGVELPPWPLRVACSHLADPELQVMFAYMGVYHGGT